jgi:hypothetical protein
MQTIAGHTTELEQSTGKAKFVVNPKLKSEDDGGLANTYIPGSDDEHQEDRTCPHSLRRYLHRVGSG